MPLSTPCKIPSLDPLALTFPQVVAGLRQTCGKGAYHAAALMREIIQRGNISFETAPEFKASPRLLPLLEKNIRVPAPQIVLEKTEANTLKFVTQLKDGAHIESVVIPMKRYNTLCVSTQAGCRMGCRFCETARHGFIRNLTVSEITGQLFAARFLIKKTIKNIVFMGMGEPFDNPDNLFAAIRVLNDPRGFDVALRHMTVSTCGIIPGIAALARQNLPGINLAVSVNSADDALRSQIMPVNNRYPLPALKAALAAYPLSARRVLLIEYILIRDVNDSPGDAKKLIAFLSGLTVRVNLIGYNPPLETGHTRPPEEKQPARFKSVTDRELHRFAALLEAAGIFVVKRWAKGRSLQAGCGQLSGRPCTTAKTPSA